MRATAWRRYASSSIRPRKRSAKWARFSTQKRIRPEDHEAQGGRVEVAPDPPPPLGRLDPLAEGVQEVGLAGPDLDVALEPGPAAQPEHDRVLAQVGHDPAHLGPDAERAVGGACRRGEAPGVALDHPPLDGRVELFLAAEVVVDQRVRDAGGGRDVAHRGGGEAPLGEEPLGRVDHGRAGLPRVANTVPFVHAAPPRR